MSSKLKEILQPAVIVAALGYFVDVYDLLLFAVVRIKSLESLGLSGQYLLDVGSDLLSYQMIGMVLGGFIFGVWGDKKGRVSVLFASITLYSLANLANAFVQDVTTYSILRFVAGVGLAGELGAGITLVSEILSRHNRGLGTTLVAAIGVTGAIVAGLVGNFLDWRVAYGIGGALGLALLALRFSVHESGLFTKGAQEKEVRRGDFLMLFTSWSRFSRMFNCVLIGLPVWFVVGILITFSPEFAKVLQLPFVPAAGTAVALCYAGLVFGDIASGIVSQYLHSRKKAMAIFLLITALSIVLYVTQNYFAPTPTSFYAICALAGFGVGFWAVLITASAEQFGTNLRATVTTVVPNLIRGSLVISLFAFNHLKLSLGLINAATIVGAVCLLLAGFALSRLHESFARDLEFTE